MDGFGAFRTLVLALETTRGDRYLRRQVYGDYITFNLALWILAKIESIQGFCFGIEAVTNSEWACVFCIAVIGGELRPPYK